MVSKKGMDPSFTLSFTENFMFGSTLLMCWRKLCLLTSLWMTKVYLPLATFAHNMFNSPNLANHSPYELAFGKKPKLLLDLETDQDIRVSGTYREYFTQLGKNWNTCTNFFKIFG